MSTFTGREQFHLGGVRMLRADKRSRIHHNVATVKRAEKLGRNDPCACGSGRKFKKCHGGAV
jgi:uncharacterized protein YchJ